MAHRFSIIALLAVLALGSLPQLAQANACLSCLSGQPLHQVPEQPMEMACCSGHPVENDAALDAGCCAEIDGASYLLHMQDDDGSFAYSANVWSSAESIPQQISACSSLMSCPCVSSGPIVTPFVSYYLVLSLSPSHDLPTSEGYHEQAARVLVPGIPSQGQPDGPSIRRRFCRLQI